MLLPAEKLEELVQNTKRGKEMKERMAAAETVASEQLREEENKRKIAQAGMRTLELELQRLQGKLVHSNSLPRGMGKGVLFAGWWVL